MRIIKKEKQYICAVCRNTFEEDEHDRFIQLHHNKAYCSFQCILKERFGVTPAIVEMLLRDNWKSDSTGYNYEQWR